MPEKEKEKGGRQLNIRLSDEEYAELERRATETGKTYRQLICEDMQLGQKIELSSPAKRELAKKGLQEVPNEHVSALVLDAVKNHMGFFGFDPMDAARDISQLANWSDLTESDRAYLLASVKHKYRDDVSDLGDCLQRIAKILGADLNEVRALFRRIVKTGDLTYSLPDE